jgi:hypothetical protein
MRVGIHCGGFSPAGNRCIAADCARACALIPRKQTVNTASIVCSLDQTLTKFSYALYIQPA